MVPYLFESRCFCPKKRQKPTNKVPEAKEQVGTGCVGWAGWRIALHGPPSTGFPTLLFLASLGSWGWWGAIPLTCGAPWPAEAATQPLPS